MTIEFNKLLNSPIHNSWGSIENIFENVIYTGAIFTIIIMIIIACFYPCKNGTPLYITLKTMFYIFVSSLVILFLQKSVIEEKFEQKHKHELNKSIVEAINRENISSNQSYIPIENNLNQIVGGDEIISSEKNIKVDTHDSVNDILEKFGV